jgi:hypothetical protein
VRKRRTLLDQDASEDYESNFACPCLAHVLPQQLDIPWSELESPQMESTLHTLHEDTQPYDVDIDLSRDVVHRQFYLDNHILTHSL